MRCHVGQQGPYNEAIERLCERVRANIRILRAFLNKFYDVLEGEFNERFHAKFTATSGFGRAQGLRAE
jgi:hypothetical protein